MTTVADRRYVAALLPFDNSERSPQRNLILHSHRESLLQ